MNRFEDAARQITGDSWLDDLARKSLASAEKRFAPTRPVIPAEAVEALAAVLAQEALVSADMDGHGWDAENDDPAPFMPHARERAHTYLQAAAPYMQVVELAAELAAEYRRGYRDGLTDRKQVTAEPLAWEPDDPIE